MSDPTTISPARSNEEEPIVHLRLGDQEIWILPDALLVQDTKLYALEASKEESRTFCRRPASHISSGFGFVRSL